MSKIKVVSAKNLPTQPPITFTVAMYLLVDKFNVDGIWLGVIITIMALYWIGVVLRIVKQKPIELFESNEN